MPIEEKYLSVVNSMTPKAVPSIKATAGRAAGKPCLAIRLHLKELNCQIL